MKVIYDLLLYSTASTASKSVQSNELSTPIGISNTQQSCGRKPPLKSGIQN
jgi:hypothetical protein